MFKVFLAFLGLIRLSYQHARLMEPPSRASMWRVGFPTPKDIDDNQNYCGGFGVQFGQNGGKCGICGDPWHDFPREHEAPDGIYATGIITKTYNQGSYIPVIVDITANHQGYFIFKICPNNDIFFDPEQNCFDAHPLWVGGGDAQYNHTRFPIHDYETGLRMVYVRLPMEITCNQCILQWTYVAGNNWGSCEDGTSGMGCGPQETFRSCADIRIQPHPLLIKDQKVENEEFYEEFILENQVDEQQTMASIRRKEALLRKKKEILKELIKKLRQLIHQSNVETEDQMTSPQRTVSQIIPPNSVEKSQKATVIPWWERVMSNRH